MGEVTVSLRNVSKYFKRYARPIDRLKELLIPQKSRAEEFWALQTINLDVFRGETLGVVGQNGSGKSTLLQIIAGTLQPSSGSIQVNGRISALLELGSGFNLEFTGRQNVFFNGRILGLSQEVLEQKFDDIAAFADIGTFIDQPVKTYSSGMFVRLAFAVAVHVDPEILIVDEALAVGDIFFQQKCFKFLEQLKHRGTSILFVSHDTQAILKLCDRAILLESGSLISSGSPAEIVAKYYELHYTRFNKEKSEYSSIISVEPSDSEPKQLLQEKTFIEDFSESYRYGELQGLIQGISLTNSEGKSQSVYELGEELTLSIKINAHPRNICPLNIGFHLKDRLGQLLIGSNTYLLKIYRNEQEFGQPMIVHFRFNISLLPGKYTIVVAIAEYGRDVKAVYDWIESAAVVDVITRTELKHAGLFCPEIAVKLVSSLS